MIDGRDLGQLTRMSLKLKERERAKACSGSGVLGEEAEKCYKLVMVRRSNISTLSSQSGKCSGRGLWSGEILPARQVSGRF